MTKRAGIEDVESRMARLRWAASTPERMRAFEYQIGIRFIARFILGVGVGVVIGAAAAAIMIGGCS